VISDLISNLSQSHKYVDVMFILPFRPDPPDDPSRPGSPL